jgi:hypothetical protein
LSPTPKTKTVQVSPEPVLRSIRIPGALASSLKEEADAKGVSLNALIASVLQKHEEWDRMVENFPFVYTSKTIARKLVDAHKEETLIKMGDDLGASVFNELMLLQYGESGPEKIFAWLETASKYGWAVHYKVHREGADVTLSGRHDLGKKWSILAAQMMKAAIKSNFGAVPQVETSENSFVLRFKSK